jgi:hypothetical protein
MTDPWEVLGLVEGASEAEPGRPTVGWSESTTRIGSRRAAPSSVKRRPGWRTSAPPAARLARVPERAGAATSAPDRETGWTPSPAALKRRRRACLGSAAPVCRTLQVGSSSGR